MKNDIFFGVAKAGYPLSKKGYNHTLVIAFVPHCHNGF